MNKFLPQYEVSTTPAHTHDCEACHYLGTFGHTGRKVDCYLHGDPKTGTLIARDSSEGPDYASVPMELLDGRDYPAHSDLGRAHALLRVVL